MSDSAAALLTSIDTEHLRLRPLDGIDADALVAEAGSPAITHHVLLERFATLAQAQAVIAAAAHQWRAACLQPSGGTFTLPWAVTVRDGQPQGGALVGTAELHVQGEQADLRYVLDRRVWSLSMAGEVAAALVRYAQALPALRRIGATCWPYNLVGARALRHAGLGYEAWLAAWEQRKGLQDRGDSLMFVCVRDAAGTWQASPAAVPRERIDTPRLLLRRADDISDAEAILDFYRRNAAHLRAWEPPMKDDFLAEEGQARRLVHEWVAWERGLSFRYWLARRDADASQGFIGMLHFSAVARGAFHSANLSYSLDAAAQGHGYMTEALQAAVAEMFAPPVRLHRIAANYRAENQRSAAVLQRLGFQQEGLARNYLYINSRWSDHVLTARINPDFDDAQAEV
jgi:ribosomal-protein-alanine N-acetyltransferase